MSIGDRLRAFDRRAEGFGHTGPQVAWLLAGMWSILIGMSLLVVRDSPLSALLPLIAGLLSTALVLSTSRWRRSRRAGG